MNRLSALTAPLRNSEFWLRFAIYCVVVFSTFGRTGMELSIVLLEFVALYRWIRQPRFEKTLAWVFVPFGAFIAVAVVSTLVNPNLYGNLTSLNSLFRFFMPFAMVPALFSVNVRRLLLVFVAIVGFITLYGLAQHYFGINWLRPEKGPLMPLETVAKGGSMAYRAKGVFRNPIIYSSVMLMTAPLLFSIFFSARGRERKVWLLGGLMGVVAVASSFTRSAVLGLFFGMLVLALRLRPRYSVPAISLALAGLVLLGAMVLSGTLRITEEEKAVSPYLARFLNTSLESSTERLYRWEAGWLAIKANPWLGVGPDKSLKAKVIPYMIRVSRKHDNYRYRLLPTGLIHNVHLQVAFHFGLIGLLANFSMWAAIFFWNGLWLRRAGGAFPFEAGILWGVSAGLLGSIIDGFFNNNFLDGMNQSVIMMFIGLAFHAGLTIRNGLRRPRTADASEKAGAAPQPAGP